MRSEVKLDWKWANGHMRAIADALRQCALYLLSVQAATPSQDLKRATDLVVTVETGDVAVRIRRPQYKDRYRELTIRAWRSNGAKTELAKIQEGFARWYLYGWSDGHGGLADWFLVDLDKLRETTLLTDKAIQRNKDGRTGFIWIKDSELRSYGCMVAECSPQLAPVQLALL